MTPYEKICTLIEAWHLVQGKVWKEFILFSSMQDDWCVRCTLPYESPERCYYDLWETFDTEGWINGHITDIKVYQRPLHYYKSWDKVEILESVKQHPEYDERDDVVKKMIWWPFVIKWTDDSWYKVCTRDESDFYWFEPRHLAPRLWYEEEKAKGKEATIIIDWVKKKVLILD